MIFAIIAFLAVAVAVKYIVKITFNWMRNKIQEKLEKKNVKKVFMTEMDHLLQTMADECENQTTLEELKNYDMVMATINDENKIEEVDLIKNEDDELDEQVDKWLSSKREIVVNA